MYFGFYDETNSIQLYALRENVQSSGAVVLSNIISSDFELTAGQKIYTRIYQNWGGIANSSGQPDFNFFSGHLVQRLS